MRSNGFTTLTWVFKVLVLTICFALAHVLVAIPLFSKLCYIKAKDFGFKFDSKLLWFKFLSSLPPCNHLSPPLPPCNHLFFSLSYKNFLSIPNFMYTSFLSHSFLLGRLLDKGKRYYYNLLFFYLFIYFEFYTPSTPNHCHEYLRMILCNLIF